ncbi:hypothetical protein J31TS4_28920 [Paenibacillus sp. J31TS4]|uniref:sporulation protein YqfD n=1 Tax=Paenibacillus sp. J31TS4 TaxID=2807195 RepID=UPI001B0BCBB1|nr:sporulation protein YqfD [Paenibacillus sp. J31TS4]GIP39612.1 hypothetical protein J31TS4_28920 [Paenibacillus sp. J31TS4]
MRPNGLMRLRGYVTVAFRGTGIEQLLNLAVAERFTLWDVRMTGAESARASMPVSDFFRLRPLLKRTGCRVHVMERAGFPFLLVKIGKRKTFAIGLLGFLLGLFLLTSVVWKVEVLGLEKLGEDVVLDKAGEIGIYRLQWKFRLQDPDKMASELHRRLPDAAWVGVEVEGTHVHIRVVESTRPDPRQLTGPRHLIASKNAIITEILADKGKPLVQPHSYVRQGDVLVSGLIGAEGGNQQLVAASGKVKGLVWYTSDIEVPLSRTLKTYTGEQYKRFYLVFGSRALQITGYGKEDYSRSETIPDRKTLHWRNYVLPVGWLTEEVKEVKESELAIRPEEALAAGLERGRADVLAGAGEEARITGEKILSQREENGKLLLTVHFEVEERIDTEQLLASP